MSVPVKARIHCAHCRATLADAHNPCGVLVADPCDAQYHLVPWRPGLYASASSQGWQPVTSPGDKQWVTVCGKPGQDYEVRIGTLGVELLPEELTSRFLEPYTACPQCFANVW